MRKKGAIITIKKHHAIYCFFPRETVRRNLQDFPLTYEIFSSREGKIQGKNPVRREKMVQRKTHAAPQRMLCPGIL